MKKLIYIILIIICGIGKVEAQKLKWFKGNVHAHTINSDGNTSPDSVVNWYKEHGYNFCILTDHNLLTDSKELNRIFSADGNFLLIPGEEVTDRIGGKPVHLNAINIDTLVVPKGGYSVPQLITNDVIAIKNANGIAILNHPNGLLKESITANDIINSIGLVFFEVCCSDFKGGSGHPSTDEIWDSVLTNGKILYGIASDDAHQFEVSSKQPGNAWIMIHASTLSSEAVVNALTKGEFYATSGIEINELIVSENKIYLRLKNEGWGFKTFFIGKNGKILKLDQSNEPNYTFASSDSYVRARVERSDGAYAWIQPVFIKKRISHKSSKRRH